MIVAEEARGVDDGELGAVLCALAGPRRGDAVAAGAGASARALRALLAAAGTEQVEQQARLVLAGDGRDDVRDAAVRLAPGGRLVALAPDAGAAAERAGELGLALRHVEPLGSRVAWSAVSPLQP